VSSKAEDFDVRYRDTGTAGHGRPAADGGYRGSAGDVDYDLGYDSPGWDTQGFRRPEAGFADDDEPGRSRGPERGGGGGVGTAVRPASSRASGGRRDGGHARATGPAADTGESTAQLDWETEATGSLLTPGLPARGRRANRGPGGPGGPGGPRGPRGPRGGTGRCVRRWPSCSAGSAPS